MGRREKDDRMERLRGGTGYSPGPNRTMKDVLKAQSELLRSEGLDPAWPEFKDRPSSRQGRSGSRQP